MYKLTSRQTMYISTPTICSLPIMNLHNDLYQQPFVLYVHSLLQYLLMIMMMLFSSHRVVDNYLYRVLPPSTSFLHNQVLLDVDNLYLQLMHCMCSIILFLVLVSSCYCIKREELVERFS